LDPICDSSFSHDAHLRQPLVVDAERDDRKANDYCEWLSKRDPNKERDRDVAASPSQVHSKEDNLGHVDVQFFAGQRTIRIKSRVDGQMLSDGAKFCKFKSPSLAGRLLISKTLIYSPWPPSYQNVAKSIEAKMAEYLPSELVYAKMRIARIIYRGQRWFSG
jgi:hypothetical protein